MEDSNETKTTRVSLLGNKANLSEEELAEIIDMPHENININLLKKYTTKKYRDLSDSEKTTLIKELLTEEPYIKYKNCWISKSKLLYDTSETLAKETVALSRLSDLGYEVYLLPYAYARDSMNCYQKSADSITKGDFLEMKSVVSTGDRAGQSSYKSSRLQADNVFISFVNDISEEKAIKNIHREIDGQKKSNQEKELENNFQGYVFLNFEKTGKTNLYKVSKDGIVNKIEKTNYEQSKKSKGTAHDSSQVAADPMSKHGSPLSISIPQTQNKSTTQSVQLQTENGTKQLFSEVVKLKAENMMLEKEVEKLTKQLNQIKQKQKSKDDDFGRS